MRCAWCPSRKINPATVDGLSVKLPSPFASKGTFKVNGCPVCACKMVASCQPPSARPNPLWSSRQNGKSQTNEDEKRCRTSKLALPRSALRLKESCGKMGAPAIGKTSDTSSIACDQV